METNRLRQFCAIVETGSIVKTAELLHLTHSALSKSMKLLQEELGYSLLRPAGRGLSVTDLGLRFYQRAKKFLDHENELLKLEDTNALAPLRIGTVEIFLWALGPLFKSLHFQDKQMTLLDLNPEHMGQMIINRELDYGITYVPFPMENIEIIEIGKYRLGCYMLKNVFKSMDIQNIPFVVPNQGLSNNPLGLKERDGWIESIYPRIKKYHVNLLSTAIELTLQGLCAIYIPDFVAHKINHSTKSKLVEYPLCKNQKNLHRAFLLKHKDKPEDGTFKQLFKIVKETIYEL